MDSTHTCNILIHCKYIALPRASTKQPMRKVAGSLLSPFIGYDYDLYPTYSTINLKQPHNTWRCFTGVERPVCISPNRAFICRTPTTAEDTALQIKLLSDFVKCLYRWCWHGLWWQHLVAAYYSFINPNRMKVWVGLVGWAQDSKSLPVKDQRLPLSHGTNQGSKEMVKSDRQSEADIMVLVYSQLPKPSAVN